jgi:hypothetical protein
MTALARRPRSRLRAQPLGKRLEISDRDIEIFKLLARFRYLPSNFILAFVGGNVGYHKGRMTDLFHEGWLQKPMPQWEVMNARYRFDTYELGKRAVACLADRGVAVDPIGARGSFRHEAMVCLIMASFELSARRHGVTLLSHKDVLERAPARTRDSLDPFVIPTSFEHQGRMFNRSLRPDARPFGIQARRTFWFCGFEADRHHEPVHPADLYSRNSSILAKLLQYRHLVTERLFETHFGMSNVFVPIITINERHMHNMMNLSLRISDGRGFKWMLFRTLPDVASVEKTIQPDMDLLGDPWLRANNSPLTLIDELQRQT